MANINRNTDPPAASSEKTTNRLFRAAFYIRFAVFCCIWLLLTGWQPSSWPLAWLFISLSSLLSLYLVAPTPSMISCPKPSLFNISNPSRLFAFIMYFIKQSLRGGWVTAKLAFRLKQDLEPEIFRFPIALTSPTQIFTLMQVISLLPGTVSAQYHQGELCIHVLDIASFNRAELDDCYTRVEQLFEPSNQPTSKQEEL